MTILKLAAGEVTQRQRFQPIFKIGSDNVVVAGFEILSCFRGEGSADRKNTQEIILAMERDGSIVPFDIAMLEQAANTAKRFGRIVPPNQEVPFLTVNLSGRTMSDARLGSAVERLADSLRASRARIFAEWTETAPSHNRGIVKSNIDILRSAGLWLMLDDFPCGTNTRDRFCRHSGAIAAVKLDKSVIEPTNPDNNRLGEKAFRTVNSLTALAQERGVAIIAEGVTGLNQAVDLGQHGVSHAQGFGLGRPVPFSGIKPILAQSWIAPAQLPRESCPGRPAQHGMRGNIQVHRK